MKHWILVVMVMVVMQVCAVAAPKLSVAVSSTQPKVGEVVTVKIGVSAPDIASLKFTTVPTIPGLVLVESSDETVVKPQGNDFVMTKTRVIRFRVTQSGRIQIPSLTVQLMGQSLKSSPLQLTASGGAAAPAVEVQLRSVVSARKVVVGQAISYQLIVRRSGPFSATPVIRFPLLEGFFQVDHPVSKAVSKVQIGNQTWYETTLLDRTLYPSQPGQLVIQDAALTIPNDPVGGAKRLIAAVPISIEVLPLPSPKPVGFSGAVGTFQLVGPQQLVKGTQYSPVSIPFVVRGNGNLGAIVELIPPRIKNGNLVKGTVSTQTGSYGRLTEQRITYLAVLQTAGLITLPPFKLIVYSPEKGGYVTLQTSPIQLDIAKGRSAVTVLDAQSQLKLRPIRDRSVDASVMAQIDPAVFWIVMALEWLLVGGILLTKIGQQYINRSMPQRRQRQAIGLAKTRLRHLRFDHPNAWTNLRRVVTDCIADRYQIQISTLSTSAVSDALTPLSTADRDGVVAWLSVLDELTYQPDARSPESFQKLLNDATRIVDAIDRSKGELS